MIKQETIREWPKTLLSFIHKVEQKTISIGVGRQQCHLGSYTTFVIEDQRSKTQKKSESTLPQFHNVKWIFHLLKETSQNWVKYLKHTNQFKLKTRKNYMWSWLFWREHRRNSSFICLLWNPSISKIIIYVDTEIFKPVRCCGI